MDELRSVRGVLRAGRSAERHPLGHRIDRDAFLYDVRDGRDDDPAWWHGDILRALRWRGAFSGAGGRRLELDDALATRSRTDLHRLRQVLSERRMGIGPRKDRRMTANIVLSAENVTLRYGKFVALGDISVAFRSGELTSIIGPNGAGKSSFFNVISGARSPTAGKNFWSRRARLVATDETARSLLDEVGLGDAGHRIAAELAHGQQRALEIAMALACSPRLLLMDEPTAGMSPEETKDMVRLIERLAASRTVVLVEHKMKMVLGISKRVIVLHHGQLLADGTPDDVRNDPEVK